MIGTVLGIILPVAVVVVIVRAVQGRAGYARGHATISLQRFFQYVILLGLTIVVAEGLAGLLTEALDQTTDLAKGEPDVALFGSFILVGGPLLVAMATWIRRRFDRQSGERDSLGWAFYLTVSLLVSLSMAMLTGVEVLEWLLSDGTAGSREISELIVWSLVWLVHWLISRRAIEDRRMQPHLLAGSLFGLIALAVAVVDAATKALEWVYDEMLDTMLLPRGRDISTLLLESAALGVVGLAVWSWYWVRTASVSDRSPLWNFYVLLVGILGGVVATLGAAGALIADALDWAIARGDAGAAAHFDGTPAAVTILLAGMTSWLYHRYVLRSGVVLRSEVHRVYDYLVSMAALVALAGGFATGIVALLDLATEPADGTWDRDLLVAAITLIVLGGPLWIVKWLEIGKRVRSLAEDEITSLSRRVYVFTLLGSSAIVAIVSLIAVVFVLLQDAFGGDFGTGTVRSAQVAIGLLLGALAVAGYHWTVYQSDRAALPDRERTELREVVLVCTDGEVIAAAISEQLGARVRLWTHTEAISGSLNPRDVVAALKRHDGEQMLVVQRGFGAFEVVPFNERR